MNKAVFILLIAAISCSEGDRKKEPVPARISVDCTKEAVSDDEKADTAIKKIVSKDSIEFSAETISNCCGWYDDLQVAAVNDTIRIIDTNTSGEHSACDCDCLFRIAVKFERSFFENTKSKILFFRDRVIK